MRAAPATHEVELFRGLVNGRLGLSFDDGKLGFLTEVLRARMEARACVDYREYEQALSEHAREEWRALSTQLTVAETFFFRYWDHFRAFVEVVLPALSGARRLRVLSAGCASGEEAYSLAVLLRENVPDLESWDVRILGVDINPAVLARAVQGVYSSWSLRDTSPSVRARYFQPRGREFLLEESVRRGVRFEERNLVDDDSPLWEAGAFDVVFCRNVTMYFSAGVMASVVARLSRCLSPGGFLFLGHAETLRGVSQDFHLCHTHDTFYYRRREAGGLPPSHHPSASPALPARMRDNRVADALDLGDTSWVDAIQRASDRIARLTQAPVRASSAPAPAGPSAAPDLRPAIELLRQERFAEAIEALPLGLGADADTALLRAVLLTSSGRIPEAEEVCGRILGADDLNAGAHYVTALCREHAGDRRGAVSHDQAATYLDPSFAMPHLHLGLLARRGGDLGAARAELARALVLLTREEPARILLFGGGFSREALVDLCRSELRAVGGGP